VSEFGHELFCEQSPAGEDMITEAEKSPCYKLLSVHTPCSMYEIVKS
jgi:hypothetical protein